MTTPSTTWTKDRRTKPQRARDAGTATAVQGILVAWQRRTGLTDVYDFNDWAMRTVGKDGAIDWTMETLAAARAAIRGMEAKS